MGLVSWSWKNIICSKPTLSSANFASRPMPNLSTSMPFTLVSITRSGIGGEAWAKFPVSETLLIKTPVLHPPVSAYTAGWPCTVTAPEVGNFTWTRVSPPSSPRLYTLMMCATRQIGITKLMLSAWGAADFAKLIPTTWEPSWVSSGPPELPGEIAAVDCRHRFPLTDSCPEMTPWEIFIVSCPSGNPRATTSSPMLAVCSATGSARRV
mmetsp:Transcript_57839/g.154516  ORF Transcript_57839/g.154516 Transcript_57839/m.154516 type:complete len:209 (-) Transcript_57839:588-1214(-)